MSASRRFAIQVKTQRTIAHAGSPHEKQMPISTTRPVSLLTMDCRSKWWIAPPKTDPSTVVAAAAVSAQKLSSEKIPGLGLAALRAKRAEYRAAHA